MRRRNRRANGAAAPAFVPLSKQHAAVTQPHAGDFDRRGHPVQHDDLVAPVKLVGFARRKTQRHVGFRCRRTASPTPSAGVATHRVISTLVAKTVQFLEEAY